MKINTQRGATLIVVLIVLLLVLVVCTVAVRKSMGSLKIATSEQAQDLTFQSSEAYLLKLNNLTTIEKIYNASVFGLVGYTTQDSNIGHEVAFCYDQNMTSSFNPQHVGMNTNIVVGTNPNTNLIATQKLIKGFCNNQFTSGRNAVITQVYLKSTAQNIFAGFTDGTDSESVSKPVSVRIHVISVIPALASNSDHIPECLSNYPANFDDSLGANTVVDCLKFYRIPYSSQVSDYKQENSLTSTQ